MTLITITKKALSSRLVRNVIGERTIDFFTAPGGGGSGGGNQIINFILDISGKLAGFLVSILEAGIKWILQNLMDILVETYYTIAYFDWAQTDKQIQEQINSNNNQIGGALGNLAGTSLVWLAGLSIAGYAALKFPVLAGRVALEIADEGGAEIRGNLISFLSQVRDVTIQNLIMSTFLSARQVKLFGLAPVTKERKPWILAEKVDEAVNKLAPNEFVKQFLQGFLSSVEESIITMGYVISFTIDDFYSNHLAAHQSALGQERTIIVTPNREEADERILISGPQELVETQLNQTLANHNLVYNRDIGLVVGQPAEEFVRAEIQYRKLIITFKSKEKPPWKDARGKRSKEVSITIPEVKRGLSWERIKFLCKPYEWGRFCAVIRFEGGRKLTVWGANEAVAKDKAREISELCSKEVLSILVTEEVERPQALRKTPTRIYPAYATLLIKTPTNSQSGQADITGRRWENKKLRVNLWNDEEPANANELN